MVDVDGLAAQWKSERDERRARRHLEPADFDALRDVGFHRMAIPASHGGTWVTRAESARAIGETLRMLGAADPSVALVAAMHPSVVSYWLCSTDDSQPAWEKQRASVFATVADGAQWGTITSEPGSGGDIFRTKTVAVAAPGEASAVTGDPYRLTGDKHFGSGFGISDYMMTTAKAEGDDAPAVFAIDMRPRRNGTAPEMRVTAEWDGIGMTATQSHAARLEQVPAVRMAWNAPIEIMAGNAAPVIDLWFTAVVLGVLDEAVALAQVQLAPKHDALRPYERVEWTRADMEYWLAQQAYEGALRAIESEGTATARRASLRAKTAIAELAEQILTRLTRVVGGGTYSRRSPFSSWNEDVRALGFLRPPWGLAFDSMFALLAADA
jgi:alkylation response protein AidB-like acyl-CoA dehydrogenase